MRAPVGVASVLAGGMARALPLTWRYRVLDETGRTAVPRPLQHAIYALWHEHLLPLSLLHRDQGAAALISRHRDGEILARVLESMGYVAVRGSSSRGGAAGLREMVRLALEGAPLAFTPDGPRGPARRCQPGVVQAAIRSGLPVIPVAAAAARAARLGSWDRFMVPLPATTVYVAYGEPLRPGEGEGGEVEGDGESEDAGEHEVEDEGEGEEGGAHGGVRVKAWAHRLERELDRVTARCEAAARGEDR